MQITLDIKESAVDKIMYLLDHLKEDVSIIEHKVPLKLEVIDESDTDFKFIIDARKRREDGEKCYPIDDVLKDF